MAWATLCRLGEVGMPVPKSKNWSMPASASARVERCMKDRLAAGAVAAQGKTAMACPAASRSAAKLVTPPRK